MLDVFIGVTMFDFGKKAIDLRRIDPEFAIAEEKKEKEEKAKTVASAFAGLLMYRLFTGRRK